MFETTANLPPWSIRHPWPDELPRLRRTFRAPEDTRQARRMWRWVLVSGDPERIVGTATLKELHPGSTDHAGPPPLGRLSFILRDRWTAKEPAQALLQSVENKARELQVRRLETQLNPSSRGDTLLRELGYQESGHFELWQVSLKDNITARQPGIDRALNRFPVPVHKLNSTSLPIVQDVCRKLGLFRLLQGVPSDPEQMGDLSEIGEMDPELCFVAGEAINPVAVALSRRMGSYIYLELLAKVPGHNKSLPGAPGALLRALFQAATLKKAKQLICAVQPDKNRPIQRLLERSNGKRLYRMVNLYKELAPMEDLVS